MTSSRRRLSFPGRKKSKYLSLRKEELGQPPGTLLPPESPRPEKVRITVMDYTPDRIEEFEAEIIEEITKYKDTESVTWINLDGVEDVEKLQKLGEHFGVHPLALEDLQDTDQRPKMEEYENFYLMVVKLPKPGKSLDTEQISILLGKKYVITVQEHEGDCMEPVRKRLRNNLGRIRAAGPDYLAYALLDVITDEYYPVLEGLGEYLEKLEGRILKHPEPRMMQKIQSVKRDLLLLRRSVWPNREVLAKLMRDSATQITPETRRYLRDCYDNTVQIIDLAETYRDMTGGLQDLYMSSISNRMNEVMKVLTIIATIFIPLGFLAGVYGMNFDNMPETQWEYGYFAIWLVMIIIIVVQVAYFRHKRWL